jgi:hypothetical protein
VTGVGAATATVEARAPVPPEAVWAVLGHYGALARWAWTIDHSCLQGADASPTMGTVRRVQVGRLARTVTGLAHDLVAVAATAGTMPGAAPGGGR